MAKPREISEHLRGPWVAVMHDSAGFCETDPADLADEYATVAVVRGSAAPTERDGGLRMPGSYSTGDVLYEIDDIDLEEDDPSTSLTARWKQAQAVAAGLNALEQLNTVPAMRIEIKTTGDPAAISVLERLIEIGGTVDRA